MPGIFGLITKRPKEWAEEQVRRMLQTMQHESFYVCGTWSNSALGIYIGWTARENSFSAKMPLRNESADVTLVFAGEEFPDKETKIALRKKGHQFDDSPASYLVHWYEDDPSFPKNVNGRFHGVVADGARGTLNLFNDRFGLQRLYYHDAREAFYFAAEAKAILAVVPELREIDARGLGEYVGCGCVLEGRTLFKNLYVLPPASYWTFRDGRLITRDFYFQPKEWEEQESLDEEAYYTLLRDAFTNALPKYFEGEEKIGISLTGGLDTRIIMAWRKAEPNTIPCYTFGSMYKENQDVYLAKRVAAICRQPYQLITVDENCLKDFPTYAERTLYLTDGCVDVGRAADLWNNQMARKIAPVRMVGTFGSEIIRGDVMFKHVPPRENVFQRDFLAEISRAGDTYRGLFDGNRTSMVAFKQTSMYHYGVVSLEQSQLTLRAPYLDNAIVKAVFRAPKVKSGEDVRMRMIREGNAELGRLRTDRGLSSDTGFVNLLQRAYLEFTFKAEYAYDYGMPQWVAQADHIFAPLHLERLWLGRHKLFHFRYWYRTILAKYVQDILLDPRSLSRPYVDRSRIETIVKAHLKGNRNYTTEIHRLISLELLHRLFLEGQPEKREVAEMSLA
jgi:asparagine synthase (glutamine-hydrolysing)